MPQHATLEQFDKFHGDNEGDRHEIGHEKPPRWSNQPESSRLDVFHQVDIAVLEQSVEGCHHQSNQQLPHEDTDDHLVDLAH